MRTSLANAFGAVRLQQIEEFHQTTTHNSQHSTPNTNACADFLENRDNTDCRHITTSKNERNRPVNTNTNLRERHRGDSEEMDTKIGTVKWKSVYVPVPMVTCRVREMYV